jgi:fibronectin type 3 domain-containing protein
MTTARRSVFLFTLVGMVLLLVMSCLEKLPDELEAPIPEIPTPTELEVVVGADQLTLSWAFDASFPVNGFSVYRSDDDKITWEKIASVAASPHIDTNVRAGTGYWYRVAAIDELDVEGRPSAPLAVLAATYAVLINSGDKYTNDTTVQLSFTAAFGTQHVRFSQDSTLVGATWLDFASSFSFTLASGDGEKNIYAQFRDGLGNLTVIFNDSIVLDTYAEIQSLSFNPTTPISPGGTIHFSILPAGSELDGFSQVFIEGMGSDPISVFDNGAGGDELAGDGEYEKDFTFPQFLRAKRMRMSAVFYDAAGNESVEVEFNDDLTMTDVPDPVTLFLPVDSTTSSITLRWSESDDEHFASYKIYRDDNPAVSDTNSVLVGTQSQVSSTTFTDEGLIEGALYNYAVYVVNDLDESSGSNVRSAETEDLPPTAVVLDDITSIGVDRLTLTWSVNEDSDFFEYKVFRTLVPGVTDLPGNQVGGDIRERFLTYFDDAGLDTTSNDYYYRIYVYDAAGQKSRSNEKSTATPPTP